MNTTVCRRTQETTWKNKALALLTNHDINNLNAKPKIGKFKIFSALFNWKKVVERQDKKDFAIFKVKP